MKVLLFTPALLLLFSLQTHSYSFLKSNIKLTTDTVIGKNSFANQINFGSNWNYLYPWGPNHNGSARMYKENVALIGENTLKITAAPANSDEGRSNSKPFLPIKYHSGAIFAKKIITVTDSFPKYELSGNFKVPTRLGTWPAFWLTAVKGWPPEVDILEFKGDKTNWQNTFFYPRVTTTIKTSLLSAETIWHNYKVILRKVNDTDVLITYYVDNRITGVNKGVGYMNKPMYLIINLQMEGGSGTPGPADKTYYYIKDVIVTKSRTIK